MKLLLTVLLLSALVVAQGAKPSITGIPGAAVSLLAEGDSGCIAQKMGDEGHWELCPNHSLDDLIKRIKGPIIVIADKDVSLADIGATYLLTSFLSYTNNDSAGAVRTGPYATHFLTHILGNGKFFDSVGVFAEGIYRGSGQITDLIAVNGGVHNQGTGNVVGNMSAFHAEFSNTGGGSVGDPDHPGTVSGLRIDGNTSTIPVFRGVLVQALTNGPGAYAYYAENGPSFFGGPILVGLGAPGYGGDPETAPSLSSGAGSPEGVVVAPKGSIFMRSDGGAGTSFYIKESGIGNTGWIAK